MARLPHLDFPGIAQHIVQRGNDRQACFAGADLRSNELDNLRAHTRQQKAWGSDRFRQQIEALTQRAAGVRPRGRPRSRDK